jgi:hypothetical protein
MIQAIEVSEEQRSCEDRSREGFKILAHWGAVSMYVRMQMSAGGARKPGFSPQLGSSVVILSQCHSLRSRRAKHGLLVRSYIERAGDGALLQAVNAMKSESRCCYL